MRTSPLANQNVVVLGGTGSFGKAFVAHALDFGASRVAVFSRDELKQSELASKITDSRLRFLIGSVTDHDRVLRALRGADIVVHAAAMKQVPACEANPYEALQTNTVGAQVVTSACIEAGVKRAVFLSTDKAANPNTLYGATKLAAERIWRQANVYAAGTPTRFIATRYGNILGSRGSVIPLFREQAKGGTVTLTEPNMTRFWMSLGDAVRLVTMAIAQGRGGEVFVPKIPSATVATLASAVAPDAEQRVIGIRPGEKMHETLVGEDEAIDTYDCGCHYRIEPQRTWEYLPSLECSMVPAGFSYRSDTNPEQLGVDEMRALIEEAGV